MADEEKIFEKLDEVIKKKKEEIEGLRKLIGSIENPTDPHNEEEREEDVTEEETEEKEKP